MATRYRFNHYRFWVLSLGLVGCRKDAEPDAAPAPVASAPVAPSPVPIAPASAIAPAAETPLAGQKHEAGSYVETSAYKFRVQKVVRCADPVATEKVPEDRRVRVAAKIDIVSKYDAFFVAGRDVTLEKGGVIIDSEKNVKPSAECAPLLEQKRLNHDETIAGFVVFQVPDEAFVRDAVVAFLPTRWGGAPRAAVTIKAKDFTDRTSAAPRPSK